MSNEEADTKLTRSLTEIPNDRANPLIDTFSIFPTKEVVRLIVNDRMLAKQFGLTFYEDEADYTSECLRAFEGKSREQSVRALCKDFDLFSSEVGERPISEKKSRRDD